MCVGMLRVIGKIILNGNNTYFKITICEYNHYIECKKIIPLKEHIEDVLLREFYHLC